jgi:hypothetical protein
MRTDELNTALLHFFILKRHHHEKSVKPVSTSKQQFNWIFRLNCQDPAKDGLRTISSIDFSTSHELRASNSELRASSFKLRLLATRYEIRDMSYELRDTRYKIAPAPADDSTVQPCAVVWLYGTDLHRWGDSSILLWVYTSTSSKI